MQANLLDHFGNTGVAHFSGSGWWKCCDWIFTRTFHKKGIYLIFAQTLLNKANKKLQHIFTTGLCLVSGFSPSKFSLFGWMTMLRAVRVATRWGGGLPRSHNLQRNIIGPALFIGNVFFNSDLYWMWWCFEKAFVCRGKRQLYILFPPELLSHLGGENSNIFSFTPILGKMIQFDYIIFFKGVETTNQFILGILFFPHLHVKLLETMSCQGFVARCSTSFRDCKLVSFLRRIKKGVAPHLNRT